MKRIGNDISLSEQFNIPSANYEDVNLSRAPLNVRQYNALTAAGINSIGELLRLSEENLYDIKNLGKGSIVGLIDYVSTLDSERELDYSKKVSTPSIKGINKYRDFVVEGKFEELRKIFTETADFMQLEKYEEAYVNLEPELRKECYLCPENVWPIYRLFNDWSKTYAAIKELLLIVPAYRRKNRAIGYINVRRHIVGGVNSTLL